MSLKNPNSNKNAIPTHMKVAALGSKEPKSRSWDDEKDLVYGRIEQSKSPDRKKFSNSFKRKGDYSDNAGKEYIDKVQSVVRRVDGRDPGKSLIHSIYDRPGVKGGNNSTPYEETGAGIVGQIVEDVASGVINRYLNKSDELANSKVFSRIKNPSVRKGIARIATAAKPLAAGAAALYAGPFVNPLLYMLMNKITSNHPDWYGGDSTIITCMNPRAFLPKNSRVSMKSLNISIDLGGTALSTLIPATYSAALDKWLTAKFTTYGITQNIPTSVTMLNYIQEVNQLVALLIALVRFENGNLAVDGCNNTIGKILLGNSLSCGFEYSSVLPVYGYKEPLDPLGGEYGDLLVSYTDVTRNPISKKQWEDLINKIIPLVRINKQTLDLLTYWFAGVHSFDAESEHDGYVVLQPMNSRLTLSEYEANPHVTSTSYRGDLVTLIEAQYNTIDGIVSANPWIYQICQSLGFDSLTPDMFKRDTAARSIGIIKDPGFYSSLINMDVKPYCWVKVADQGVDILWKNDIAMVGHYDTWSTGRVYVPTPSDSFLSKPAEKIEFTIGELGSLLKMVALQPSQSYEVLGVLQLTYSAATGALTKQARRVKIPAKYSLTDIGVGTVLDQAGLLKILYTGRSGIVHHEFEQLFAFTVKPTVGAGGVTAISTYLWEEEDVNTYNVPDYEIITQLIRTNFYLGSKWMSELDVLMGNVPLNSITLTK